MISVIVNVYNGEKYIKKCLESIINQTYKDLEIVIINDGSTDNTLSICKSFKDKRIKIVSTKNFGLSKSRNIGIDNSKGDYLFFVDSDDYIEKDTIEYLYDLCIKNKTSLSICQSIDIFDYNYQVKNPVEKITLMDNKDFLKKILLFKGRYGNIWGKLIKRELINTIRFEERRVDDVAVVYKMIMNTDKIAYSNQIKYYYFRHNNSALAKINIDYCIDYYKAALERYDYIKNIYPDLIENDISMLWSIVTLYGHDKKELNEFLNNEKSRKVFNKMFTLKALISNLKFRDKIKILLFRINPKLYINILNKYLNKKYTR